MWLRVALSVPIPVSWNPDSRSTNPVSGSNSRAQAMGRMDDDEPCQVV